MRLRGILVNSRKLRGMMYEDTLEELQRLVGGYIEYIELKPGLFMIVNEEGKIHNLYFNEPATNICQSYGIKDCIKGNAFIVRSNVRTGNNTSCTYNDFADICRRAES